MKWFKHLSDASSNEDILEIEEIFGWEGYGRWFKLLEAVAVKMDKSDRCSVAYPWPIWQTILKGKRNKLETFLVCLENKRLLNQKLTGNILEIEIPKLLKYRDESTSKSGKVPKKIPTQELDTEEPKGSKEGDTESPKPPKKGLKKSTEIDPMFVEAMAEYPPRAGGHSIPDAWSSFNARKAEGISPELMLAAIPKYRAFCEAMGNIGTQYILQPESFFGPRKRGWERDWTPPRAKEERGGNGRQPPDAGFGGPNGESLTELLRRRDA